MRRSASVIFFTIAFVWIAVGVGLYCFLPRHMSLSEQMLCDMNDEVVPSVETTVGEINSMYDTVEFTCSEETETLDKTDIYQELPRQEQIQNDDTTKQPHEESNVDEEAQQTLAEIDGVESENPKTPVEDANEDVKSASKQSDRQEAIEFHDTTEEIVKTSVETEQFIETPSHESTKDVYMLNTSSRKFHLPECSSVLKIKETNRAIFEGTIDSLVDMGYTACGICCKEWVYNDTHASTQTESFVPYEKEEIRYVINKKSKKFHIESCSSAKKINAENREEVTGSREALLASGYSPCGICKP